MNKKKSKKPERHAGNLLKYICLIVLINCIDRATFTRSRSQIRDNKDVGNDWTLFMFTVGHHLTHQFLVGKESV